MSTCISPLTAFGHLRADSNISQVLRSSRPFNGPRWLPLPVSVLLTFPHLPQCPHIHNTLRPLRHDRLPPLALPRNSWPTSSPALSAYHICTRPPRLRDLHPTTEFLRPPCNSSPLPRHRVHSLVLCFSPSFSGAQPHSAPLWGAVQLLGPRIVRSAYR